MIVRRRDDHRIRRWDGLRPRLIEAALAGDPVPLEVRTGRGTTETYSLDLTGATADPQRLFDRLGLSIPRFEVDPVIGEVVAD